jgi:glucokinase
MLAPRLGLPLVDKDEILEELFESRGTGDAAWRRQLSRESDAIVRDTVSKSQGAVVCSFWHVAGMPDDSGTPTAWLGALSSAIVAIHCVCTPEIAAERFLRRTRHAGHLDERRAAAEVIGSFQALALFGPVTIGETVVVDTTRPLEPDAILQAVAAAFRRRQ